MYHDDLLGYVQVYLGVPKSAHNMVSGPQYFVQRGLQLRDRERRRGLGSDEGFPSCFNRWTALGLQKPWVADN